MAQLIDCELTDRVRNLPAREGDMREELSTKQIGGWGGPYLNKIGMNPA